MKSICKELDVIKEEYRLEKIILKGIQDFKKIKINEYKKIIIVDERIIENDKDFEDVLKNIYMKKIFNENTKIHIKLKVNLSEYLLINNYFFPTFIKIKK